MPHPSKRKGDRGERMVVAAASQAALEAIRARGSDGRSLGHAETVDVLAGGARIQVKTRSSVAAYLEPPDGTDVLALVQSRRGSSPRMLAVVRLEDLLRLIGRAGGWP